MDLTKAFESVPLHEVWRRGVLMKFPLKILRLGLELCCAPLHLTCNGAVLAEGVVTNSAVLAGLTFATDYMFLALAPEIDRWIYRYPGIVVAAVVDDISIQVRGKTDEVGELFVAITTEAMADLRALGCVVSAGPRWLPGGKTMAVASCGKVRGAIQPSLKAAGVVVKSTVRHVGLDYAAGKARQPRPVRLARLRGVKSKAQKCKRLGYRGKVANRLCRTSLVPAAVYGAGTLGLRDSEIEGINSMAHGLLGPTQGRSAYARLLLSGGLPTAAAAVLPIVEWANHVFAGELEETMLRRTWMKAWISIGNAEDPETGVCGPASGAAAALRRIGWTWPAYHTFAESNGNTLSLRDLAPTVVRIAALEAYDFWAAATSSIADKMEGVPDLSAFRMVMRSKATSAAAAGCLRACAEKRGLAGARISLPCWQSLLPGMPGMRHRAVGLPVPQPTGVRLYGKLA